MMTKKSHALKHNSALKSNAFSEITAFKTKNVECLTHVAIQYTIVVHYRVPNLAAADLAAWLLLSMRAKMIPLSTTGPRRARPPSNDAAEQNASAAASCATASPVAASVIAFVPNHHQSG